MNFQKNDSMTKTIKFLGMGVVSLSAALVIGLPSSAQGNSDSSSGGYADPNTSPAGAVDSPSDSVNSTTDPNYGEPQDGSTTSGSTAQPSGTSSRDSSTEPMSGERTGPSAVGEGFPGSSEAPAGSPSSGTSIEDPTRSK